MKTSLCSLILLLASVAIAHAQQPLAPPPPPSIGWGFDEFHIGGEMLFYPRIGRDSFNMDFIYHYGGFPSMDYLSESVVPHVNDSVDRRNIRSMIREAHAQGMKLIYAPHSIFNYWPGSIANSLETYFDFRSDTLSLTDFLEKADPNLSYVKDPEWIENRYVASVTVESSGSGVPDTFKIVGAPRFTQEGVTIVSQKHPLWQLQPVELMPTQLAQSVEQSEKPWQATDDEAPVLSTKYMFDPFLFRWQILLEKSCGGFLNGEE